MKRLFAFALAVMMLCLCGCKASEPEPAPEIDEPVLEITIPDEEPEAEPGVETEEAPAETEPPTSLVDTKFYTLTLPNEWIGKCICDMHERDDGSYSMSVHEINDFLDFGGGTLFTIMMLPTTEDYTIFPSYELLGSMDTPEGTFYLVALFPTDVQFTEENVGVYNEMYEGVADVLDTLAPKNGIILEKTET